LIVFLHPTPQDFRIDAVMREGRRPFRGGRANQRAVLKKYCGEFLRRTVLSRCCRAKSPQTSITLSH